MMDTGTLRWKFDISAFRLIGRDLITDRVTALFELVKNCYDANANVVFVHFNNVSPDSKGVCSIVIEDDGDILFLRLLDVPITIHLSRTSSKDMPYPSSSMTIELTPLLSGLTLLKCTDTTFALAS